MVVKIMIGTKCPGQDMRYWTAEDAHEQECPLCGTMIEFFKTDIRLRCPNCKSRVANTRFDMGCAQWCAYTEQCLGPAAKGLKGKSLRAFMEDELARLTKNEPATKEKVQDLIGRAEKTSLQQQLDLLPIVSALVIIVLQKRNLISDYKLYLEELKREHNLPQQALNDTEAIITNVLEGRKGNPQSELVTALTAVL